MTQRKINEAEWRNPDNWGGPRWLSVYFSKRDTRIWVPRQIPWTALWLRKATPNLAHGAGVWSSLAIRAVVFVLLVLIAITSVSGLIRVAGVAGSSQVSRQTHPWQSPGDPWAFRVDTTKWTFVGPQRLGRVGPAHVAKACELLAATDAVEISPDTARRMCPTARFGFKGRLKPFLVRAVAYGKPLFSTVKRDSQSGWIYILQSTGTGELSFLNPRYALEPAPIVILLEEKPARVVCAANEGGDAIFRGVDFDETWQE